MNNYALRPNSNGYQDTYLDKNQIARVSGNDQIAQRIKTLLQTFMGEFFLDQNFGIPWVQTIFQKPANQAVFDSIIKRAILSVQGVKLIASFDSVISAGRTYTINTTILDQDGVNLNINFIFGGN